MKLTSLILISTLALSSAQASAVEKVKGKLRSHQFGARTNYVIDQENGFIGVYTKAKALFVPINDSREF